MGIFVIPRVCLIRKYGSHNTAFFLYFSAPRGAVMPYLPSYILAGADEMSKIPNLHFFFILGQRMPFPKFYQPKTFRGMRFGSFPGFGLRPFDPTQTLAYAHPKG